MLRIAVLVSGRGTNFKAILDHIRAGRIRAEVALLLSNAPDAPAIAFAREAGIPVWAKSHKEFPSRAAFDDAMLAAMREANVEAVVLAGYMRLLSPAFIQAYEGKILNIHPSLLPSFTGVSGGPDALAYGVKLTGCTVHFVVNDLDAGPVVIQAAIPVFEDDTEETLMVRVHAMEHRIYPQAVAWFAENRLVPEGRVVRLLAKNGAGGMAGTAGIARAATQAALVHPPLEEGF
ncbi:Phosphoribosylglycinamide formyltransferase, formyltetrahydrofolate-dependent [uncultured delta proteobacterium]|uniref:Phosphoribosylglycinamide formyltransferase n=1 Tax=uncultured delta proteobacterium TaxID=34034 RepID=A0A212JZH5_9DELT|nr:Phosphoribosylglycinamide formyltransferase, formyltetrahydrofolate-dependent [uncultured delta proteobacterium]